VYELNGWLVFGRELEVLSNSSEIYTLDRAI